MTDATPTSKDLLSRLNELWVAEMDVATSCDMRPEDTANWGYSQTARDAIVEIELLREFLRRFMACRSEDGLRWRIASGPNAGDALAKVYLAVKKYFAGRCNTVETRASAVLEMYEHLAVGVEACPNCPTCQRNAEETLKAHRESGQKASAPLNCDCPNGSYGKKHRADCALNGSLPQQENNNGS